MNLCVATLLALACCQVEPDTEDDRLDPRTQLPAPPSHGLSLKASAHGQGGAVAFAAHADVDRRRLRVGEPLTLTVTLQATGEVFKAPEMPNLARDPRAGFAGFEIEPQRPSALPGLGRRTWIFVYKLRPRSSAVTKVPAIVLMYWDPVVQSNSDFITWPIVETDALPLEVLPLEILAPPLVVPPGIDHFAPDSELLARKTEWRPPSVTLLVLLILFPPLLCIVLYAIWKRSYPDALTTARRQQSRAARAALRELALGRQLPPGQCAEHSSTAVARYLRARLERAPAEPTPTEAAHFLKNAGVPEPAVQQTAAFLRACDAARFGGGSSACLPEDGSAVVLLLEAQTWAPSSL